MSNPSFGASPSPPEPEPPPRPEAYSIARYAAELGSPRNVLFLFLAIVSLFVFWTPLTALLGYSQRPQHQYDKYSHTLLIPFITMAMVFLERRRIFASVQYRFRIGVILLLLGLTLKAYAERAVNQLGEENALSMSILGLVIFWTAGFILCYGTRAYGAGAFPLLFLLLGVPIPNLLLDAPLWAVRYESTEVCSLIFNLAGVPFLHNGFGFVLPTIAIEVAEECGGIHATLALLIASLVAGHLFLPSLWKKVLLVLFVVPIVSITNGLRIAGLTLLTVYVDPGFMHGSLHRQGGMGFFLLALLLLFAVLRLLQWGKRGKESRGEVSC
ncbi:MAG TPA: exosortase/archaeosortase family protein [Terriglobia bacterium]|nr:exosortase/archaeosortase family protein [Terriglobia bacterium]